MARTASRAPLLVAGLAVAAAVVAAPATVDGLEGELFDLTVIGGVVVASALLAEASGVVSAVYEILLGFLAGLAGAGVGEAVDAAALLGGSLLMFMAGLEVEASVLRRYLARSLAVGGASFAAPAIATYALLAWAGYPPRDCALAAVGVSTTSVAVVYSIIRRTRLHASWRGVALLASAMAADVISILAFTAVIVEPGPELLAYAAALFALPPLAARILDRAPALSYEAEVRIILALILAVSLFSEAVGIHGVLFSFMLGVAFSESRVRRRLEEKLSSLVFGFLAPLFFTVAGIHIADVEPARLKYITLLLLASSYPTKVVMSHLAMKALLSIDNLRLANVMAARLTVSTIIAYAGLKSGLLDQTLAAGVMASALVATLLSGIATGGAEAEEEVI